MIGATHCARQHDGGRQQRDRQQHPAPACEAEEHAIGRHFKGHGENPDNAFQPGEHRQAQHRTGPADQLAHAHAKPRPHPQAQPGTGRRTMGVSRHQDRKADVADAECKKKSLYIDHCLSFDKKLRPDAQRLARNEINAMSIALKNLCFPMELCYTFFKTGERTLDVPYVRTLWTRRHTAVRTRRFLMRGSI